jgi:hypothetical protein
MVAVQGPDFWPTPYTYIHTYIHSLIICASSSYNFKYQHLIVLSRVGVTIDVGLDWQIDFGYSEVVTTISSYTLQITVFITHK